MLMYLCPALIDLLVFVAIFAVVYGAGAREMPMARIAWLANISQITYMFTSLTVGFLLTRRNARLATLAGIVSCVGSVVAALMFRSFWPLMLSMAVFGISTALFFNAFQTFMRGEAPPGGLVLTTGLYTLAWSGGSSLGFIATGMLYRPGSAMLAALTMVVGAVIFTILVLHRQRPGDVLSAEETVALSEDEDCVRGRYVWVAWLIIFATMFAQRPILTLFPALCAQEKVSAAATSLPLSLHMLFQAIAGFCMVRLPTWRYRRWPLLAVQGGAGLLMLFIWRWPQFSVAAVLIPLLGIWTGFAYFMAVFYASNAGNRSRNVGVNEFLVGLGSSAGVFLSEFVMKRFGVQTAFYLVCASAVVSMALAQVLVAGRSRRSTAPVAALN